MAEHAVVDEFGDLAARGGRSIAQRGERHLALEIQREMVHLHRVEAGGSGTLGDVSARGISNE
jgi:hypothetical protein